MKAGSDQYDDDGDEGEGPPEGGREGSRKRKSPRLASKTIGGPRGMNSAAME